MTNNRINSISISGYKAIKATLELKELAQVNYLVGENGSGKSSVIETITKFDPAGNDKTRGKFLDGFPTEFRIDSKIIDQYYYNNGGEKLFELSYFTSFAEGSNSVNGTSFVEGYNSVVNNFWGRPYDEAIANLVGLNKLRSQLGLPTWEFVEPVSFEFGPIRLSNQSHPDISENGVRIDRDKVATGFKQIIGFQSVLEGIQKTISSVPRVVLLEEPENNMHPKYQKLIPTIISQFPNIQFIITTHSPFIISAATKYKNQKVYVFKNGKVDKPEGFEPKQVRSVVGELLGAQVSDLAPNKVVFVDGPSTLELLKAVNERFYNESINFLLPGSSEYPTSGGDEAVIKYLRLITEVNNKSKILYPDSDVYYCVDSPNKQQMKNQEYMSKLQSAKRAIGSNLITLEKEGLEYCYKDISSPEIIEKLKSCTGKEEKAKVVGENISKEDFEKIFADSFVKLFTKQNDTG